MMRQPYDLEPARHQQRALLGAANRTLGAERDRLVVHDRAVASRSSSGRSSFRRSSLRLPTRIGRRIERLILGAAMELMALGLERRIVRVCRTERELNRAVAAGRP